MAADPARAGIMQCPAEIGVAQHVADVPQAMRAFDSEPHHRWINAQFSDGPPDQMAWLAPDATHKVKDGFTNVWTFGLAAEGTWLSCGYTGTSMVVSFRLPETVRRCQVRYDSRVSPPAATAVDCR